MGRGLGKSHGVCCFLSDSTGINKVDTFKEVLSKCFEKKCQRGKEKISVPIAAQQEDDLHMGWSP